MSPYSLKRAASSASTSAPSTPARDPEPGRTTYRSIHSVISRASMYPLSSRNSSWRISGNNCGLLHHAAAHHDPLRRQRADPVRQSEREILGFERDSGMTGRKFPARHPPSRLERRTGGEALQTVAVEWADALERVAARDRAARRMCPISGCTRPCSHPALAPPRRRRSPCRPSGRRNPRVRAPPPSALRRAPRH